MRLCVPGDFLQFFCTKPCAFADVCEPISRGEHFIQEATTQVKIVTQIPCLPSAQSYACLALAEGCRGRLGSSRRLWLLCFDMLLSLTKEPRPPPRGDQGSSRSSHNQQEAQLYDQDKQRNSLREEIYQDQPRRQTETEQMNMEWEPNPVLLRFQIRRTILALGLFCIERSVNVFFIFLSFFLALRHIFACFFIMGYARLY